MAELADEELQLTVPESVRMDRADKILARLYPDLSRSRWQKLLQEGRVWQDDRMLSQKNKLHAGDVVDFSIPAVEPFELRPVPMDLVVLFEDADILVIDKAAGRVVHPGAGTGEDTLVHGILHHCEGALSGIGGQERPGIVHRLDKETSGILIVAKTDPAFHGLADQFSSRSIQKFYTALVRGTPDPREGTVDQPIGRHPVHRTRMDIRKDGRAAQTDYTVTRSWDVAASLLWLQIHTGRTHQIRVHMKHLGHPVLGDVLYGYKGTIPIYGAPIHLPEVPRVMLHATRLKFSHPITGKPLCIDSAPPADFQAVIAELDKAFPAVESR